jgi:hypothetical protein
LLSRSFGKSWKSATPRVRAALVVDRHSVHGAREIIRRGRGAASSAGKMRLLGVGQTLGDDALQARVDTTAACIGVGAVKGRGEERSADCAVTGS